MEMPRSLISRLEKKGGWCISVAKLNSSVEKQRKRVVTKGNYRLYLSSHRVKTLLGMDVASGDLLSFYRMRSTIVKFKLLNGGIRRVWRAAVLTKHYVSF